MSEENEMMSNKHKELFSNYDLKRSKQLDKLATKMLKDDEKNEKLRSKKMTNNFFSIFNNGQTDD